MPWAIVQLPRCTYTRRFAAVGPAGPALHAPALAAHTHANACAAVSLVLSLNSKGCLQGIFVPKPTAFENELNASWRVRSFLLERTRRHMQPQAEFLLASLMMRACAALVQPAARSSTRTDSTSTRAQRVHATFSTSNRYCRHMRSQRYHAREQRYRQSRLALMRHFGNTLFVADFGSACLCFLSRCLFPVSVLLLLLPLMSSAVFIRFVSLPPFRALTPGPQTMCSACRCLCRSPSATIKPHSSRP